MRITTDILDDQIIDEDEHTNISNLLNCIIGSLVDNGVTSDEVGEHWKFSSFGPKIQKAMYVRDGERSQLKIIC